MKYPLTQLEDRMRQSLWRDLFSKTRKYHTSALVVERVDVVRKTWACGSNKKEVHLLEGRLERNVWSGDVSITFRRYSVPR